MPRFRFKMRRYETRDGEIEVTADNYVDAARTAASVEDRKVPRGCDFKSPCVNDQAPSIEYEILSGRLIAE